MPALNIAHQELRFKKVSLRQPSDHFYLLIAAEIDHPLLPVFFYTSEKKRKLIDQSKRWCKELNVEMGVTEATVFKATVIPPGQGRLIEERKNQRRPARYDFVILIEVTGEEILTYIQDSQSYAEMLLTLKAAARRMQVISTINVKRIDTVDHSIPGVFLFNYFLLMMCHRLSTSGNTPQGGSSRRQA